MADTGEANTLNSRAFRNVMGLFATGVTVIAAEAEGEIHGMTANAITSVSLDPMLVLVCVQKNAHMAGALSQAGQFSINILDEQGADLSNFFAGIWTKPEPPPFTFEPWIGGPRLQGAIGSVGCKITHSYEGGDHWIVVAEVIALYHPEGPANPLLFYRGRYRRVSPET
jgi:flavin reductase (DIM6/NTAB) family NADH-FMN oxidoreductase RutF